MKKLLILLVLALGMSLQSNGNNRGIFSKVGNVTGISGLMIGGSIFGAYGSSKINNHILSPVIRGSISMDKPMAKILTLMIGRAGRTAFFAPLAYISYKAYFDHGFNYYVTNGLNMYKNYFTGFTQRFCKKRQ